MKSHGESTNMDIEDKQYIMNRMQKIINLFEYLDKEASNIGSENEVIIARPFTYILYSHLLPEYYQNFDKADSLKNFLYLKKGEPKIDSGREKNEASDNSFFRKNRELLNNLEDFISVYFGYFRPHCDGTYSLGWLFSNAGYFFEGTNFHEDDTPFLIRAVDNYKYYDAIKLNEMNVAHILSDTLVLFSNKKPNTIEQFYIDFHDKAKNFAPMDYPKFLLKDNSKFESSMFKMGLKAGKLENYKYAIMSETLIHLLYRLRNRIQTEFSVLVNNKRSINA